MHLLQDCTICKTDETSHKFLKAITCTVFIFCVLQSALACDVWIIVLETIYKKWDNSKVHKDTKHTLSL